MYFRLLLVLCITWSPLCVFGQIPPAGKPGPGQASVERSAAVDSTVRYVTAANFYQVATIVQDTLHYFTHQYDPTRLTRLRYAHLGNLGSAHRRQFYDLEETKGLDIGQHQYRLYQRRFDEFRFYEAASAMTEFDYSQGLDQLDGILKARFGRNFAKGVKTSIDYLRINQEGAFNHQRGKHTAFGFGVWLDTPDGRYDGLYHYGSNSIVQEDNGGITSYEDLQRQQLAANVPVRLTDGLTTHRARSISAQNHFHLNPPSDSVRRKAFVDIIHTGQYKTGFVRFSDENISSDTDYYRNFVLDDRGIRHFIDFRTLDNRVDLQFRFKTGSDAQHHALKAGLQYRHTRLRQEPNEEQVNETFLNAAGQLWITPTLALRGEGYIGLTGQSGDFKLHTAVDYQSQSSNHLSADLTLYSRSPNVTERALYVAQIPVWQTDLNDYTHSRLHLKGELTGLKLSFGAMLHLSNNAIYFDTARTPVQLGGTEEVFQIYVRKVVSIGKLGLDVTAALQEAPDVFALPSWIINGQLYYQDRWFKQRLLVRTGVDLRVTDAYRGVNYFPVTGQFHLDDSRMIDQYPALDVFFDMQVKETFRAFFKMENVTSYFLEDPFIQVVDYPQFESYFRIGLWMKLFD